MPKGQQSKLLHRIGEHYCFDWSRIAKVSNVCERTLRDWRSEKYNMSYEALLKLQKIADIPIPKKKDILPEYWSARKFARKGGLKRYQIYGDFATVEGRKKGGINSQKLFHLNPEYARNLGIIIRKDIQRPKPSIELAEFIGIVLGDGGLTNYQLRITFNRDTDVKHADFVQRLIKRLFGLTTKIISRKFDKGSDVVVYSKNLVEFLEAQGLQKGNKVRNQVDLPLWIKRKKNFQISCLRGLMDSDGSFYQYYHRVNGNKYLNSALCFTNYSNNLLNSAFEILKTNGFNPSRYQERVYVYKKKNIERYFESIGSHNPKHLDKYKNYLNSLKSGGVPKWS